MEPPPNLAIFSPGAPRELFMLYPKSLAVRELFMLNPKSLAVRELFMLNPKSLAIAVLHLEPQGDLLSRSLGRGARV